MKMSTETKIKNLREIVNGSKAYEFDGTILELTGYYTGKRVRIDLERLADMLEDTDDDYWQDEILPDDDDDDDEDYDDDEYDE